jgi:hypothetical protein
MTTKGRWPKVGGLRLTTGGIRRRAESWVGRSCARVICNVIWKVNGGQYAYDVGNGTPVEKGGYQPKAGTRECWTRLMQENVPFVSEKVVIVKFGKLGS